jgi:hypothetical protein
MSHTLSEAKAVVSSLEASGINCNTSLVSIVGTVLRFKVFGMKYLVCVAHIE